MLASSCGARTTLDPLEETQADFVATDGGRAVGGNGFAQGGYGIAATSGRAQGGVVSVGGSGTTVDPPPICAIDGHTYRNHETNPLNPCESCQILISRKSWSLEPFCMTRDPATD
jgi:hypothetical protein